MTTITAEVAGSTKTTNTNNLYKLIADLEYTENA